VDCPFAVEPELSHSAGRRSDAARHGSDAGSDLHVILAGRAAFHCDATQAVGKLPVHFADPAFRDDAIRGIRSTVNRLNQLIERAGSLRHKLDLDPVELDLNSLVSDSGDSLDSSTPNIRWVTKLDPLPKVRGDREQLQSVITNLLLNAREAIETTGAVTVETVRKESWASLAVADNGCGMTSRFLKESLFRPFQTTKKKGLGIGMFQSKVIVEAHHGKISVMSEPGVGTTFSVLLPISAAQR
jgi:signal transduction histidine kinase